jgi:hypothetical protein
MASNSELDVHFSSKTDDEREVKRQNSSTRTGRKRGRKPLNRDAATRAAHSRQNARECRARKKLRYQFVEELVSSREKAVCALRQELGMLKQWCISMDSGFVPTECIECVSKLKEKLLAGSMSADTGH